MGPKRTLSTLSRNPWDPADFFLDFGEGLAESPPEGRQRPEHLRRVWCLEMGRPAGDFLGSRMCGASVPRVCLGGYPDPVFFF